MSIYRVTASTDKQGSDVTIEIEIDDECGMSEDDIEDECRDTIFEYIEWSYEKLTEGGVESVEQKPVEENSEKSVSRGENVLREADAIAGKDRSRDYGHPKVNHDRIAKLWNAYCDINGKKALFTARDVAVMMILLKIARDANAKKFDNLVDMAGYVKCAAMIDDSDANHRNGLDGPAVFDSAKYGE